MFGKLIAFLALTQVYTSAEYIRGCYYTNWAQYRNGKGKFIPSAYQPGTCTHLFYAFVVMNPDYTAKPFEWNDEDTDWSKGMYSQVIALKQQQPDLKVLLSFGGWTFSEQNVALIRSMASSPQNRQTFIQSVKKFIDKYHFDGFDLDWEYPQAQDKTSFAALVKDFRTAFDAASPRLLLSAAVSANPAVIQAGYDGQAITAGLDMVNIMSYDFYGAWQATTGHNSPLYGRNNDHFSISDAAAAWEGIGVPKNKLVIGLATYGRGWTLAGSDTSVGAQGAGAATAGSFTREAGFLAYYEICDLLAAGGKRYFDDLQQVPYVVSDKLWYSYDDVQSIKVKSNWVVKNGYAGAFVWALDMDDFTGSSCSDTSGQKYPLINTIKSVLTGGVQPTIKPTVTASTKPTVTASTKPSVTQPTVSTKATTSKPTNPTATTKVGGAFVCPGAGPYPVPGVCTSYYSCPSVGEKPVQMACPPGTHFSATTKYCDWPDSAKCVA